MPIAKSPLFDEVKKAFPTCDIRMRKNKKIEIAKFRYPSNPRTPAQQARRQKYGMAVQAWRSLSQQEKEQWNAQAEPLGISGWNLFFKNYTPYVEYETTIQVSEDTFSYQGYPNNNYNNFGALQINNAPPNLERLYLKFNLSTIPSTAIVEIATLSLYWYSTGGGSPAGKQLNVHRILANWSETTLTWNNAPSYDSTVEASANFPSSFGWIDFNVKDLVQKFINGTYTNYGFLIKYANEAGAGDIANLRNKESGTNIPKLYVKYKAPP